MLKIKKAVMNQPVTTTISLLGQDLDVELLPLSEESYSNTFRPFRKRTSKYNPMTKQMDLQTYFDDENAEGLRKALDDTLVRVLVNFHGTIGEDGLPLDGTLNENKLLLGNILVDDIETIDIIDESGQKAVLKVPKKRRFEWLIIEKAKELSNSAASVEIKN